MAERLTKRDYAQARELAETRGTLTAGKLINHFRISANSALKIMDKLKKEGLIDAKGVLVRAGEKRKGWQRYPSFFIPEIKIQTTYRNYIADEGRYQPHEIQDKEDDK